LPLNDAAQNDAALDVARLTPSVPVTATQAAEAARTIYGLSGKLNRLPGETDDNFSLQAADGHRYVVKVAHLRSEPTVVSAQVRILMHLESVAPNLPVQRVIPSIDETPWVTLPAGPLQGRILYVTTYLAGQLLRSAPTSPSLRRTLGATLAALARALRNLDDPFPARPLLWDLVQLPKLRELISPDASAVCGIIDFGDVTVTALVNDVAIAAYQLGSSEAGAAPT
jgi:hydroxylysine kinase